MNASSKSKKSAATTTKEWWTENMSTKPGPSRIRVTVSREFTPAELEFVRSCAALTLKETDGEDRMRASGNRIWYESDWCSSRDVYELLADFVAEEFVNIFPTAVRTFRELV